MHALVEILCQIISKIFLLEITFYKRHITRKHSLDKYHTHIFLISCRASSTMVHGAQTCILACVGDRQRHILAANDRLSVLTLAIVSKQKTGFLRLKPVHWMLPGGEPQKFSTMSTGKQEQSEIVSDFKPIYLYTDFQEK